MKSSSSIPILIVLAVLTACPAPAQEIDAKKASLEGSTSKPAIVDRGIHVTDELLRTPESQAALQTYIEARKAGQFTAGKRSAAADTIGQTQDFNVRTNILVDSTRHWTSVNFTLRAANSVANVWVETSLDGTFSDQDMDELEAFILSATPERSIRPDRGIVENNNDVFGDPPSVEGDGIVDILLHDIEEGNEDCCVLGYVTSVDLSTSPSSEGNRAEVLYVDLPDGLRRGGVDGIAGTIAHEYQHLIHFAYIDAPELTFVNEGMSEWAELINGLPLRAIYYLQNTAEHDTPLLQFRANETVSVRENDYQRSGLFTTYIADRIGWEATGSVVQAKVPGRSVYAVGEEGYEVILEAQGLTLEDIVADFHAANFVNENSIDSKFAYSLEQRQTFVVTPTTNIDGNAQTSASTSVSVKSGSVHYVSWTDVADLDLDVADSTSESGDPRAITRFRLYVEPAQGAKEVIDLPSSVTTYQLHGEYDHVTLIVASVNVMNNTPLEYTVSSNWATTQGSLEEETISYDDGQLATPTYIGNPDLMLAATKFDVPTDGRLEMVFVAPVWDNQFPEDPPSGSGLPAGLPRDFTLYIWEDDGAGLPGAELFSMEQLESTTTTHVNQDLGLEFLAIDLSEEESLSDLPAVIYIGLGNAGTDENVLSLAYSESSATGDVSFLYYPFSDGAGWAPFSAITSGGEAILAGMVLPIRAQFLVPTADDDASELPATVSLEQNYPNPFNPSTRVEYSLPTSTHVRLAVYDVLGRQVATIVDGYRQAGTHTSVVDAEGWSSGLYFYVLETEGRRIGRQMIVLK